MKPITALAVVAALSAPSAHAQDLLASRDLADLSIEELAALPITSVARRETRLDRSPASIYVITAQDIRRSGATTIPEVLRLAPNLQVGRVNAIDYAITARGFNNAIGNKLLVMIDGRTVYTPVFSGVFWEMQDTMLQDIERIEIISGPGATLWGANAVNGVINIITRPAAHTQGTLLAAEVGTDERGAAARHGGPVGDNGAYRIYARTHEWDRTRNAVGESLLDRWDRSQLGFRADWRAAQDAFTVQGDLFRGSSEDRGAIPERTIAGHNVLGRWTRGLDSGGSVSLQAYWDHQDRDEFRDFRFKIDTLDVHLQHELHRDRHRLIWGGGYRHARDEVEPGAVVRYIPGSRAMNWYHLFAQGEVQLTPELTGIAGMKLESNPFTGTEYLPNVRLAWQHAPHAMVWASAARAVRSPSRFDRDLFLPTEPPFVVEGGPDFVSEVAHVYELGYRAQPSPDFSYSLTAYHSRWDDLRSGTPPPPPLMIVNHTEGTSRGVEGWAHWQVTSNWRLSGGGLWQDKDLRLAPGVPDDTSGPNASTLHNDPDYQIKLHSRTDIGRNLRLDLHLRHVAELKTQPIPAYTELDVRLGWNASDAVELSLIGRNLLNSSHVQFGSPAQRSEFERSMMLRVEWRF